MSHEQNTIHKNIYVALCWDQLILPLPMPKKFSPANSMSCFSLAVQSIGCIKQASLISPQSIQYVLFQQDKIFLLPLVWLLKCCARWIEWLLAAMLFNWTLRVTQFNKTQLVFKPSQFSDTIESVLILKTQTDRLILKLSCTPSCNLSQWELDESNSRTSLLAISVQLL